MCKTWTITYACNHTIPFRLSTCRGTFTMIPKRGRDPKAACANISSIALRSVFTCGPCQKAKVIEDLDAKIEALRLDTSITINNLVAAEEDYRSSTWGLEKRFPAEKRQKPPRPEKGPGVTQPFGLRGSAGATPAPDRSLNGSILKQQVQPEDVVEKWEPNPDRIGGWSDDWSSDDYPSLAEQIAADQAAADAQEEELEAQAQACRAREAVFSWDVPFDDEVVEGHENPSVGTDSNTVLEETIVQHLRKTEEPKVLPPHLKSLKFDVDIRDRLRCMQSWVAISS